jgi:high-affinity iron transporter
MRRPYEFRFLTALLLALAAAMSAPALASETSSETKARQVWQLLDYIAVDYAGAVSNGSVRDASEYAEMQEFASAAAQQLAELPRSAASDTLLGQAARLRGSVAAKAEPAAVASQARALAADVLKAYPFPVAPKAIPDVARGARLFEAQCATCHGAQGRGDGPLAATLDPRPTALSDHARARQRTLFALHQIIGNGVAGTAMNSFASLSDEDRWALAFFVGTLPYSQADRLAGAELWRSRPEAREAIADLVALTQTSEDALAARSDAASARDLTAYLRNDPRQLAGPAGGTGLAKTKLAESLATARQGDRAAATKLALSAYLDGFEPIEPALATRDRALFEKIETGMVAYRAMLANGSLAQLQGAEQTLQRLLDEAQQTLAPSEDDALAAFIGALTILLREGLEALLVVVAMVAFLKRAERRDVLVYVHAGWASALVAGGMTWLGATYLVGVSGASREMTEGFSSLFAAVVLLGVGMWMHQKSVAGRWQIYLREKLSAAMNKRTAWFLFSLAFIAVYREVFETVLFYAALWTEGNGLPLLAGLGTGVVLLAIVAAVLLRTSARLPIGQFFMASSLLVAVLAVVLAGKGIAGLQEAGLLHTSPIAIPRIDVLGIYPSLQTLLAQAAVLLAIVIAFVLNVRSARPATATGT